MLNFRTFFTGVLFFPLISWAQIDSTPVPVKEEVESIEDVVVLVEKSVEDTRFRRGLTNYFVLVNFAPFDILLPNKLGLSMGLKRDASRTLEIEYLRGHYSLPFVVDNLGSMTDDRISLIARHYAKENSLNFSYGISYFNYSLRLGSKLLQNVNKSLAAVDLVKMQSLGFNLGVGNRWIIRKNITLGVDWFSWSQPVITISRQDAFLDHSKSSDDRGAVGDLLRIVSYFPRFSAIKIQLGISF